jgi:hypothetical protein
MLDRFVFRRDDDETFPDDSKAPIRASGTTSWNAPFGLSFCLADTPSISRIYAHLPGFPPPTSTHHHLVLRCVGTMKLGVGLVQDFFIYSATNPTSLKALPLAPSRTWTVPTVMAACLAVLPLPRMRSPTTGIC